METNLILAIDSRADLVLQESLLVLSEHLNGLVVDLIHASEGFVVLLLELPSFVKVIKIVKIFLFQTKIR